MSPTGCGPGSESHPTTISRTSHCDFNPQCFSLATTENNRLILLLLGRISPSNNENINTFKSLHLCHPLTPWSAWFSAFNHYHGLQGVSWIQERRSPCSILAYNKPADVGSVSFRQIRWAQELLTISFFRFWLSSREVRSGSRCFPIPPSLPCPLAQDEADKETLRPRGQEFSFCPICKTSLTKYFRLGAFTYSYLLHSLCPLITSIQGLCMSGRDLKIRTSTTTLSARLGFLLQQYGLADLGWDTCSEGPVWTGYLQLVYHGELKPPLGCPFLRVSTHRSYTQKLFPGLRLSTFLSLADKSWLGATSSRGKVDWFFGWGGTGFATGVCSCGCL